MKIREYDKLANKIVNAFLKNKIIKPLPKILTKKLDNANDFRKLCESKIQEPVIGFKAAGTGIPLIKKLFCEANSYKMCKWISLLIKRKLPLQGLLCVL